MAHYSRLAPHASIASAVEALFVYERDDDAPHVAIPRPEIDVMVRFGASARNGLDAHAFGGQQRVRRKTLRGVQRTVTARLRLDAPESVLSVPASAIAGRIVALEDLWGEASTRSLFDQLADARDAHDAATIFQRAIAARIPSSSRPRRSGQRLALDAAGMLRDASFGSASVHAIAGDLGVSERHLRRVFRDTFGVAPKTFARLARFDRALRAARQDGSAPWANIATAAGYYDQAHLIAEFRAIAGATPRALACELREVPALIG